MAVLLTAARLGVASATPAGPAVDEVHPAAVHTANERIDPATITSHPAPNASAQVDASHHWAVLPYAAADAPPRDAASTPHASGTVSDRVPTDPPARGHALTRRTVQAEHRCAHLCVWRT